MFELKASVTVFTDTGVTEDSIQVEDLSNWGEDGILRSDYALYLFSNKFSSAEPEIILGVGQSNTMDVLIENKWYLNPGVNCRIESTLVAIPLLSNISSPVEGTTAYDSDNNNLLIYKSNGWIPVTDSLVPEVILRSEYNLVLNTPFMLPAYSKKSTEVLDYLKVVSGYINQGAHPNKANYARQDCDYASALIYAAEYNWGLAAYGNFYEICNTLNDLD